MAERNVAVRLSANVNSYVAAMAKAKAATTGLSDSSTSLVRLGGAMQSVGRTMSVGVTLPLLAVGAGAVSMAAKFDTAFAQMVGLANVPAAEIDGLKESVLSLAGETAVAPQELAEGLYFAASAGLDAAAAMDAVELAAKASAAGMGTTQDVVGLVASAVASYGEANITAAEATDILTSTIREGRAEPAELASTLGRVLPIAADLGVTFDDVGASVALLTNVFGDTNRSVTAFQGMLVKLQTPSRQGRAALEEFGLSVEGIRQAISEDGLLGAFKLLTDSGITENSQAFAALFDDIEGRQAALALLNTDAATLTATFGALDNSTGSLDTAFNAVSDTAGFKMKQAMTDIKVAMIQVGDILLPIAADIGSAISGLVGWFSDLDPAVQKLVVAFAGLAAAAGPVLFIAGSLIKNWQLVSTTLGTLSPSASKASKVLGGLALAAGLGMLVWKELGEEHVVAAGHIDTASSALMTETVAAYTAAVAAGEATTAVDALAIAHDALSAAIADSADEDLSNAMARLDVQTGDWLSTLVTLRGETENVADVQRLLTDALDMSTAEAAAFFYATAQGEDDLGALAEAAGVTEEQLGGVITAMATANEFADSDEINKMALAFLDAQMAMGGIPAAAVEAAEGIEGARENADNAIPVYEEFVRQLTLLEPAERDALMASDAWTEALAALPPEMQAVIAGTEGVTDATEEMAMRSASAIDTMSRSMEYWDDVNHILDEYSAGIDTALGHGGDWVRQHYDMAKAFREFADGITDGEGEIDLLTQGIDANTEAGGENAGTILDMADGIIAMTKANLEAGKSQEETTVEYQAARTALLDAAEAAGLNRADVEKLIDTYGLVPELVTTAMQIANDALMKWRIDRYLEKLDEIPEEVASQIEAAIDANDWATANRLLNQLAAPRSAPITPYLTLSQLSVNIQGKVSSFVQRARGGFNASPELAVWGEAGPEAMFPLNEPGRIRQLWEDPRISGPMMAAIGGAGSSVTSAHMSAAPMSGGDVYVTNHNVVNMPPGADGDDVVRALKQWQRRSGPLPLAVRSA